MVEIPFDVVINFDQTGIIYIPVSSLTIEVQGAKHLEVAGKDDKCRIIAAFAGSMTLLPQLVYRGKTECLPELLFQKARIFVFFCGLVQYLWIHVSFLQEKFITSMYVSCSRSSAINWAVRSPKPS